MHKKILKSCILVIIPLIVILLPVSLQTTTAWENHEVKHEKIQQQTQQNINNSTTNNNQNNNNNNNSNSSNSSSSSDNNSNVNVNSTNNNTITVESAAQEQPQTSNTIIAAAPQITQLPKTGPTDSVYLLFALIPLGMVFRVLAKIKI